MAYIKQNNLEAKTFSLRSSFFQYKESWIPEITPV
jgi:hypothetical protein